jgi:hypothetical protein
LTAAPPISAAPRLAPPRDFTTPSPSAPAHHAALQPPEQAAAARWWRAASLLSIYVLHTAGNVLLPTAWFVLGASRLDVLHGAYLAWLLLYFLEACLRLAPPPPPAPDPGCARAEQRPAAAHTAIRLAGSLHLLAAYLALAAQLPGLASDFNEALLRLLGLWDPSVAGDLVPVLAVLLAATLHAAAGRWLAANSASGEAGPGLLPGDLDPGLAGSPRSPGAAAAAATAAPAGQLALRLSTWVGKVAIAGGVPATLLLGYLLLLADTPTSLLGLGYLVLLALLLLAPPTKHGYLALQRYRGSSSSSSSPWYNGLASAAGSFRRSLRWVPLALLALYCGADLALQYLLATGQAGGRQLLPAALADFLRDVVGLDGGGPGAPLVARLARPALLLLALYAYRSAFVVGLAGRLAGGAAEQLRPPGWAEAKQASWAWLLRRLAVLHANKLLALAAFYCAMHLPSAAGLALVGALALVCLALRGRAQPQGASEPVLLGLCCGALEVVAAAWLVAVYAFQVGVGAELGRLLQPALSPPSSSSC